MKTNAVVLNGKLYAGSPRERFDEGNVDSAKPSRGFPLCKLKTRHLFMGQVFLFPILVDILVALTFVFHGRCEPWQWWVSVGFVVLGGFLVSSWRVALRCALMCAGCLCVLWIMVGMMIPWTPCDELWYHQPAMRMILEGWNPVYQDILTEIQPRFVVSLESVRPYHILAMPKGIWYFGAASYYFCHAPFNLQFPLVPILALAVAMTCWTHFQFLKMRMRMVMVVIALGVSLWQQTVTDNCIALAATGLLVVMYSALKDGKWSFLELFTYSFWMCVAKQLSLLHCVCFWLVFAAVFAVRREWRALVKMLPMAGILLGLFCLVCASPYLSSWRDYGHPFYPRYSGDDAKHTVRNITDDFLDRNEDAANMSHFGAWCNAYVSPALTHSYYRWRTGQKEFVPTCRIWRQVGSPVRAFTRIPFLAILLLIAVFGGPVERIMGGMLVFGTLAVPTEMIGYDRYTPWLYAGVVFLLLASVRMRPCRRRCLQVASVLTWIRCGGLSLLSIALSIDQGTGLRDVVGLVKDVETLYSEYKFETGNVLLLQRQVPELAHKRVEVIDAKEAQDYTYFYGRFFSLRNQDAPEGLQRDYLRIVKAKNKKDRLLKWPVFMLHAIGVKLPLGIWARICDLAN